MCSKGGGRSGRTSRVQGMYGRAIAAGKHGDPARFSGARAAAHGLDDAADRQRGMTAPGRRRDAVALMTAPFAAAPPGGSRRTPSQPFEQTDSGIAVRDTRHGEPLAGQPYRTTRVYGVADGAGEMGEGHGDEAMEPRDGTAGGGERTRPGSFGPARRTPPARSCRPAKTTTTPAAHPSTEYAQRGRGRVRKGRARCQVAFPRARRGPFANPPVAPPLGASIGSTATPRFGVASQARGRLL